MVECRDCGRGFPTERALWTHQGKVHGSVLGPGGARRGPRWRRCKCDCGDVHPPLRQISGFQPVPLLDPWAMGGVVDPGTGEKILIFDALRSIDPGAYNIHGHPFSSSTVKVRGGRGVAVGRFQATIPDPSVPGVRCVCRRCGHSHIRHSS